MADVATTASSYMGQGIVTQILTGIVIVVIVYLTMATMEYLYKMFMRMWRDRLELFPDTYTSGSKMFTAIQNPTNPAARTILVSNNQRSGVEFSYSMFIYLNSSTFANGTQNLYHIMHKGYSQVYPLLGPGIFCWGNSNTLRVYMNSYDTWDNYTEVENVPVDKWFHIVVSCKGSNLYIYINGNLKQKFALSNAKPAYQNFGNVYLFSSRKLTLTTTQTASLKSDPYFTASTGGVPAPSSITFDGSATGMASRVYYFSYALTYTEIQALMNVGPSLKMSESVADTSMRPYLSDTWWANRQGP